MSLIWYQVCTHGASSFSSNISISFIILHPQAQTTLFHLRARGVSKAKLQKAFTTKREQMELVLWTSNGDTKLGTLKAETYIVSNGVNLSQREASSASDSQTKKQREKCRKSSGVVFVQRFSRKKCVRNSLKSL